MSKKNEVADGTPRRVWHVPFTLQWGRFLRVMSGGLANQLGRRFGANTKLVHGVIGYIDYLRPMII